MGSYWLLGVIVLVVMALVWVLRELLLARRQRAGLATRIEELTWLYQLQAQSVHGLTSSAIGVDRRLKHIESRAQTLDERQDSIEHDHVDERPYDRAIRMAKQGAGVRRLVEELELSESEADLIARMHGDGPDPNSIEI